MIELSLFYLTIIPLFISLLLFLVIKRTKNKLPYYSCETLLSPAELKFYDVLDTIIPKTQSISCKVRLADIIQCSNKNWDKGHGHKISSKHLDFVLFDKETSKIILCCLKFQIQL